MVQYIFSSFLQNHVHSLVHIQWNEETRSKKSKYFTPVIMMDDEFEQ